MPTPIVAKISQASKEAWPEVLAGLSQTMRSLQELAGIADDVIPQVEEYVARGSGTVRRRKICEETIWVLARLGWLRTGGERDVVLAAKNWYDHGPDASDDEVVMAEDALIDTIKSLPEYLTTPKES